MSSAAQRVHCSLAQAVDEHIMVMHGENVAVSLAHASQLLLQRSQSAAGLESNSCARLNWQFAVIWPNEKNVAKFASKIGTHHRSTRTCKK